MMTKSDVKSISICTCDVCGHKWKPRNQSKLPKKCPRIGCQSYKWNRFNNDDRIKSFPMEEIIENKNNSGGTVTDDDNNPRPNIKSNVKPKEEVKYHKHECGADVRELSKYCHECGDEIEWGDNNGGIITPINEEEDMVANKELEVKFNKLETEYAELKQELVELKSELVDAKKKKDSEKVDELKIEVEDKAEEVAVTRAEYNAMQSEIRAMKQQAETVVEEKPKRWEKGILGTLGDW